jgi:anthranilate synthase/aminodeoxychorismate synthase-like glutamine amidotransferase
MILLIDNYDSFVYNLARYFERLGLATTVVRNDAVDLAAVGRLNPAAIVISPGPCTPMEAGCSVEIVREFRGRIPILGVCLGHQAVAVAYGGRVVAAREPMHGRTSVVHHDGSGLFRGIGQRVRVARYHSLVAERSTVSVDLRITSWTDDGTIMALEDEQSRVYGVQFHPESILTPDGYQILTNFVQLAALTVKYSPDHLWEAERRSPPITEIPIRHTPLTH